MVNYESKEVLSMLPHRWPFLMIDKVIKCEPGKSAIGIKNVTIDEQFFAGHFPTEPILPGVMIIESIAQTVAIMYCSAFIEEIKSSDTQFSQADMSQMIQNHVGYLVEIKAMKFMKTILPGDTMYIEVQKKGNFGLLSLVEAQVRVDNVVVVSGKIAVSEK